MGVEFKQRTLDNGLTIVAEVDPDAHTAAAGFFVRTGARDEDSPVMGVSHFLEHMMFKGTDDLSADDINRGFDDLGARNNAYTSGELTCFYASCIPERFGDALGLLSKMMRPALRQDDFDTEKNVILEEIAMYRDNPFWVLYEECTDRRYRPHGLAHRVLGTDETITALQRDQMLAYFEDRYSADNTTLSLAGRVDFDHACALAEELCGRWQTTRPGRDRSRPRTNDETFAMGDAKVSRGYVIGIADAPAIDDDDRYAAALAAAALGGPDNSRLHWALIETGLADEAQAAADAHDGAGDYFVYASGDPGRLDEIWSVIEREAKGLRDSLDGHDLERLRTRQATAAALAGERPGDRMQRLGRLWTMLGRYISLEEDVDRIARVTLEEARAVLDRWPIEPRLVGRLMPGE
ncbi:MAG: pitrilysin family protein [Phycisphaerales bacterium]